MSYNSRFEAELRELVDERVSLLISCILNRQAVPDLPSYNFLAGQLDALRLIVPELCEEANRKIDGEHTDGA